MKVSKKLLAGIVFVEVQIILILLIWLIPKSLEIEKKVERTNQFLFTVLQDQKIANLQLLKPDDIVVGDANAPVSMILYTKYDCSACKDFYSTTYKALQTEYVNKGILKIIVRYLTHENNEASFFAAKCAQYAFNSNDFDTYNERINSQENNWTTASIKEATLSMLPGTEKLDTYLNSDLSSTSIAAKAQEARMAGIRRTPTIIVNGQKLVGNRKFKKLQQMIEAELNGF